MSILIATPLSKLSDHDWAVVRHRHSRGINWCVRRAGSRWMIGETFGHDFPLFRTKKAAGEYLDNLIMAESYLRTKP